MENNQQAEAFKTRADKVRSEILCRKFHKFCMDNLLTHATLTCDLGVYEFSDTNTELRCRRVGEHPQQQSKPKEYEF